MQIHCAYARFENVGSKLPYFGEHIFLHLFSRNVLLQEGASKLWNFLRNISYFKHKIDLIETMICTLIQYPVVLGQIRQKMMPFAHCKFWFAVLAVPIQVFFLSLDSGERERER